jgi:DNA modification methylase
MSTVRLHHGDALDALRTLSDASIDAIVTDPPYGLTEHKPATVMQAMTAWCSGDRDHVPDGRGFMGRAWDGFVPPPAVWDECLRVLRPGGYLLTFAGTRTVDLMGLSVRLAGFEIRDSITWLHSQGFPKGKAQLKPASEPIIVARKVAPAPWLNIGGCRVGRVEGDRTEYGRGNHLPHANTTVSLGTFTKVTPYEPHTAGRWPSNVVLTHAPDCGPDEAPGPCVEGCPVAELDAQGGVLTSGNVAGSKRNTVGGNGLTHGAMTGVIGQSYADTGTASRFFPTFRYQAKAPTSERPKVDGVAHPTVKPLALMRWLVRLVCPKDGVVLDPFAGSGTTLQAARDEGFAALGVERAAEYLPLIRHRIGEVLEVVEAPARDTHRPVDQILAAIEATEPRRPALLALWKEHAHAWTDVHTAAVKSRLSKGSQ